MENKLIVEKLYLKFEKLKAEAKSDVKFDKTSLDSSFDNTNKLMKYINLRSEWNRVLREFERQRKDQYRKCFEYYQTEYQLKLSSKDEYTLFIESDPSYLEPFSNSQITKEVISYIDSVIDVLKGRGFEIKHALEYEKFKNGVL